MTHLNRYVGPILKLGFIIALVVALAVALYPLTGEPSGNGDKVQHLAAFYALTLLGVAAYPRRKALVWVVVILSAHGALIEILQPLPWFGRDRDVFDWVADNFGIALAILPILLAQWRARWPSQ